MEIEKAKKSNIMIPNYTHFISEKGNKFVPKNGILEMDLLNQTVRDQCQFFQKFQNDRNLIDHLSKLMPELELHTQAIKVQWNQGNKACFPIHSDSDSDVDKRQISAIVYLNEDWKKGDGGELRIYPFPFPHVDIEPLYGRMVLFSSPNILHRVLPSNKERYCFTIWFYGNGTRNIDIKPKHNPNNIFELPLSARYRKHVARVFYEEEWSKSLSESHVNNPELPFIITEHKKHVETIKKVFERQLPILLSQLPFTPTTELLFSTPKIDWF